MALEFAFLHKRRYYWQFRCDCGNKCTVRIDHVRGGLIQSCGCLWTERFFSASREANTTHGMTKTPEFKVWDSMLQRCTNPKHAAYHRYGGRGIKICKRWRNSFENFYADMGLRPSPKHSIERIDNDRGYSPWNCKWATSKEQAANKRSAWIMRRKVIPIRLRYRLEDTNPGD